eukprot:CAMPEP_0170119642 /NCGR_PEP_ID=MMETSP0020_2-20130122/14543_1 /TAXON_ID=98059 /ORGANISM="Dinobryon sp., Strain UTEXLB2267" /LENGTH=61 /DNA_ID=CAMNT_0010349103 /DNA_START=1 /DNA_END=183 /DNA_ORIENTATION=-
MSRRALTSLSNLGILELIFMAKAGWWSGSCPSLSGKVTKYTRDELRATRLTRHTFHWMLKA